ncbi:hypothetical protein, partial [Embleya sp. NPDC059259]|uniref:hypothetical protein n=1 Tax=Embleya sp. NPDC059259 TaxID=3346796 RepID=UPI00368F68DA
MDAGGRVDRDRRDRHGVARDGASYGSTSAGSRSARIADGGAGARQRPSTIADGDRSRAVGVDRAPAAVAASSDGRQHDG